ncbi:NnrS family protein [Thiothrix fructosivorans]|uniref:NnrS family protein n=1 Tax=Thiothrix fructosivorans TaxID=111770 RepID=A0ABS3IEZ0_9GAMM|nr:NnrS family protein [Thiothrix fructosivorans]MBO0611584.1 NnrS family protein [Thiothrix fructosivorans]
MLLNLEKPYTGKYALHHLGFRPFFLGAGLFAVIGMILWAGIYGFGWSGLHADYPAIQWHAHEMVFGYAVAVAAGFLLTAVKNWTNQQTLHEEPLLVLAGAWALARLLPFVGVPLIVVASVDTLFLLWLAIALARPIIRSKQWKQLALVGKIALLVPANIAFYLGILGYWAEGVQVGLYAGFYIILALIFTMGRRVIPFFIERGVGCPFTARNDVWVDRFSLVLFLLFAVADVIALATGNAMAVLLTGILALVQAVLHGFRLQGWYHANIWEKPLLWALYLAYGWLVIGFLLKFLHLATGIAPVWIHAFAYGGIALMTVGMMTRVSLGHTGRDVSEPPAILPIIFLLLFAGAFVRVVNAALVPEFYAMWILSAQLLWIAAFALFVWQYAPMLIKPRIDGRYG